MTGVQTCALPISVDPRGEWVAYSVRETDVAADKLKLTPTGAFDEKDASVKDIGEAENVKPGSHQLNVSAEGFEGFAQTIEVTPGARDITVRFREVRLNAKLAVVHKHRIGDCKGELSATPQGLRYTTTDKDDAFNVTLADLETFQVDYLQKTLRVKIRKGKQFNFTDPEGNADRLFVFHRDVDKARSRLAKGDAPAQ